VPDQHGSLQSNRTVLDEIEGILTSKPETYKWLGLGLELPKIALGIRIPSLVAAGDKVTIEADAQGRKQVKLQARVINELEKQIASHALRLYGDVYRADVGPLSTGAYSVVVEGVGATKNSVAPVRCTIMVWEKGTA
jgi:hypothetical protein